mgnify:CR=1 FL=1
MLDANTFTDSDVIDYLKDNFISLKIDGETKYGSELFNQYKGTGYPLLLFLDSNKNEIDRFYGSYDAPEFLKKLKDIKRGKNTLPTLQAEYEKGDHSVESLSRLAEKYSERGNDSLATSLHNQILKSKNLPINLFYKSKFYLSAQALKKNDSSMLESYLEQYPDSPQLKDAVNQLLGFYKVNNAIDKELKYFQIYINQLSNDPWFLNQFSWRMTELNQNLDLALEKIDIALSIIEKNEKGIANIIDTKAEILWKMGKTSEAIETINEAILYDPTNTYYQEQKSKFIQSLSNL